MSRSEEFYGAGDVDRLFQGHPSTMAPFPMAGGRKDRAPFEQDKVNAAVSDPHYPVTEVDPRGLQGTQPRVTRAAVQYYLGEDYNRTGQTYADPHQAGNRIPTVYRRDGTDVLLSGHHRAVAALLQGRQFTARVVEGTWGAPRRS